MRKPNEIDYTGAAIATGTEADELVLQGRRVVIELLRFQVPQGFLPHGALAYPLKRVAIEQFMAQAVIKEHTHDVTNLRASRTRQRQRS